MCSIWSRVEDSQLLTAPAAEAPGGCTPSGSQYVQGRLEPRGRSPSQQAAP
jgi:hypothetical protein